MCDEACDERVDVVVKVGVYGCVDDVLEVIIVCSFGPFLFVDERVQCVE